MVAKKSSLPKLAATPTSPAMQLWFNVFKAHLIYSFVYFQFLLNEDLQIYASCENKKVFIYFFSNYENQKHYYKNW